MGGSRKVPLPHPKLQFWEFSGSLLGRGNAIADISLKIFGAARWHVGTIEDKEGPGTTSGSLKGARRECRVKTPKMGTQGHGTVHSAEESPTSLSPALFCSEQQPVGNSGSQSSRPLWHLSLLSAPQNPKAQVWQQTGQPA